MKDEPTRTAPEAELLNMVEQAMRFRAAWGEVCSTHWGRGFDEVLEALTSAAERWSVQLDKSFARRAAMGIHAGSWE
ncbi:hypothetical protein ACFWA1_37080 [Streptomyces sp. NPDC060005]|uniref:hypothetical protein n=1 Tax=Streptomyces sp. NPDC060005 TaxID=3347034 RepID=UPI003686550C